MKANDKENKGVYIITVMQSVVITFSLFHSASSINERWCPKPCRCYNDYESSDCSQRALTHLPRFSNLTKRIYAENNVIQDLHDQNIANLHHLVALNLENNTLLQIHFKAFCGLSSVMEISLKGNKIKEFLMNIDDLQNNCRLEKLIILDLNRNQLRTIPGNLSLVAPNLKVLNLAYNNIHTVRLNDDFSNLFALKTLDISGNPINGINGEDLAPLQGLSLETLKLSECTITNISKDAFQSLSNVTSLSLSSNLIYPHDLQDAFSCLASRNSLQHLDLSDMILSRITDTMLNMFKHLKSIDISHSDVQTIQPQVFTSLSSVETMNLEKNMLSSVEGINRMKNLSKLYLRHNNIQHLNLTGMESVEIVDVSCNQLSDIPQHWLDGVNTLNVLNLSNNHISTIHHKAFKDVVLHTLDLSFNKLTTFHRYGLTNVQNLYMSHNKINTVTDNAFDNLEPILEELDLSHNTFTQFPLLIERDFLALQRLNLRNNFLGKAMRKGHLQALMKSLTHLQVLDLSYNQIVSIPRYQVHNLHHLTTLLLQGNRVTNLQDLAVCELNSLAKLVVSQNLLRNIEAETLDEMVYLEVLDLSDNPFDCSCHALSLQHWLNFTMVMILNSDNYQCSTPLSVRHHNIQTVQVDPRQCLVHTSKLTLKLKLQIIGAVIGTLVVLVVLTTLVCYYNKICSQIKTIQYKWQVRYREVSAVGAEFAGDDHDVTERLTVENVYAQNVST